MKFDVHFENHRAIIDAAMATAKTEVLIGRVERGLDGRDEEILKTNIIWKNVFVGNRLPDEFDEESFGVAFENGYEI